MACDSHTYARACSYFRDLPVAAAMARGIEISLVHGDVMLAKWATRLNYVTLSEVQQHVPSGFERGTYKITFRDEDLHSANGRCGRKCEQSACA